MKIQVTQQHLDKGKPELICKCPVALAIKDVVKSTVAVLVHNKAIYILPKKIINKGPNWSEFRIQMSKPLEMFVESIDNHKEVKPRTINVEIPKEYLKEGVKS